MICPILSYRHPDRLNALCKEDSCAWWDDTYDNGKCCIFTIAKNLNYTANIRNGTKTLFVREA